jgi:hypothetical protein
MSTRFKIIDILGVLVLTLFASLFLSFSSYAATSDSVTATVSAQYLAVSVSDGAITYGSLGTSATEDTTTNGINDSQTATNDSNVTADLEISGQDSTDWTLGGTAGSDVYTHKFCTSTCDSSPSWTALTTSYQDLAAGVSASATQDFDLQVGTPTTNTASGSQSVDVTVLVTEAS